MEQHFQYDVFLSHSAKDKAVVRPSSLSASTGARIGVRCRSLDLAERVRAHGLRVWFDEWVLKPGTSILSKIEGQATLPFTCHRRTRLQ